MESTIDYRKIVSLLSEVESTIGRLYKIYADKHPEKRDFWQSLVREEDNHARLIESLNPYLKEGIIKLNESRCKREAIETVLNFARGRIELAQKTTSKLYDALFTASQIEKNVIENDFCSFFEGDSPDFKKVCSQITDETKAHREKIQKLLEENRPH